jgi:hypothetical protein
LPYQKYRDKLGRKEYIFMLDIASLSAEIQKYENKWIAIDESEEKVVGIGDNALEANADAEQKGYQETILFKVPSFDSAFIPLA